jgi:hypothetical protein
MTVDIMPGVNSCTKQIVNRKENAEFQSVINNNSRPTNIDTTPHALQSIFH